MYRKYLPLALISGLFVVTAACAGPQTSEASPPLVIPAAAPAVTPIEQQPAATITTAPIPVTEMIWKMKKGRLQGAAKNPAAKVVAKVKNKKTPGFTIDRCYDYGKFSIFETKSTDEVGSAEIYVRHETQAGKNLCAAEFKGRQQSLRIREGSFAGVAGEYVVTEGADDSEGMLESQIFSLESGKEVYRAVHNPNEEFTLTKEGAHTSLVYFAKVAVKCELVTEGQACWKKILELNKMPKSTRMPDCKSAYAKTNTPAIEFALVTARAKVANIEKPRLEFTGGAATCIPEP